MNVNEYATKRVRKHWRELLQKMAVYMLLVVKE